MLSVVVPLYNEVDNADLLHQEIRATLDGMNRRCEILYVDDGSTDGTRERLKAIQSREQRVSGPIVRTRVVCLARNFGQTAAMQAGFDHAAGDVIVTLDGDLQNDPEDIPRLVRRLEAGYDMVCGWRKYRQDRRLSRVVPSKAANGLIRFLTGVPIHDNGCSLKAYRRSLIQSIRLYSDMHRFLPALGAAAGARIAEIVVNHRPRRFGETKYGIGRVWKVLVDIVGIKMLVHFHHRPMSFFGSVGFVSFWAGIALGIGGLVQVWRGKETVVFAAGCLLALFLAGSELCWGLLAEFLVRTEWGKRKLYGTEGLSCEDVNPGSSSGSA